MSRRKLVVLGSTGSVGRSTLDVVRRFPERFEVLGLAAGRNMDLLATQVKAFGPPVVAVADADAAGALRAILGAATPEILVGPAGACTVATLPAAEYVMAAISGSAGMLPTAAAVDAGKCVGLANKESMVL